MADQNLLVKKEDVTKLIGVRACWTDALFEAKGYKGAQTNKKFKLKLLIPKDSANATAIKNRIVEVAKEKWGKDADKVLAQLKNSDKFCLQDGDAKEDVDGFAGNYVLSTSNKRRPRLLRANREEVLSDDGTFYSGCYVVVHVNAYAYDGDFGKGISCGLQGVQFYRDGEAFSGGRISSVDEFDDVETPAAGTTLSGDNASFM
jgi:hypothetical protein